jgi:mRNA-degrading endonuclease RelE of RelBE toxin-antitoxin system
MALPDYTVEMLPAVDRDLKGLDKRFVEQFFKWADSVGNSPTTGCKRLRHVNHPTWRKRLGRMRVIFAIDPKERLLLVMRVDLRDDDTYDSIDRLTSSAVKYIDSREKKKKSE